MNLSFYNSIRGKSYILSLCCKGLIPCFLFLCLLAGCKNTGKPHIEVRQDQTTLFSGQAMTIDYSIVVGMKLDEKQATETATVIQNTFQEIDSIYNKWNPSSELSRLNSVKSGMEIPLSLQLERFLYEVDFIVAITQGRFDPTIEPLQHLWKKKLQEGAIPNDSDIAQIAPAIGWDKIHFGKGRFSKSHDLTELDLGGIAKGLCVDMLTERLNMLGFMNVYVEWGGEIRTTGRHPEDRPWTIFISRLGNADPTQAVTLLTLENRAIATSGDYLQNWAVRLPSVENTFSVVTYFHVFNSKTLQPFKASYTSIASASVAAPTCTFADGLATAAMTFDTIEEAKRWAEDISAKFPETSFWLMTREQLSQLQ